MCGRYVTPDARAMESCFHLGRHNWKGWITRYNVGPTMPVPIVYRPHGEDVGEIARWGLIPSWWKKETPPTMTFNARSEEAAAKPTWRHSLRAARCLMPARGWYEWNEHETVLTSARRKGHQPYFFQAEDRGVVAIAGLWATWHAPDGSEVLSCALLTREAPGGDIARIHHRMPVVLAPAQFDAWLSGQTPADEVSGLIAHARTDFTAHRVSTRVNSTRNDGPDLLEEVPPAATP